MKDLYAYGFTRDLSHRDRTDEVDLTSFRIAQKPEFTFVAEIPKGSAIKVTGVRECWNCPADRISYAVTVQQIKQLKDHPVFARAEAMRPENVRCGAPG